MSTLPLTQPIRSLHSRDFAFELDLHLEHYQGMMSFNLIYVAFIVFHRFEHQLRSSSLLFLLLQLHTLTFTHAQHTKFSLLLYLIHALKLLPPSYSMMNLPLPTYLYLFPSTSSAQQHHNTPIPQQILTLLLSKFLSPSAYRPQWTTPISQRTSPWTTSSESPTMTEIIIGPTLPTTMSSTVIS